jgi:hypothetical protein
MLPLFSQYLTLERQLILSRLTGAIPEVEENQLVFRLREIWSEFSPAQQRRLDNSFSDRLIPLLKQQMERRRCHVPRRITVTRESMEMIADQLANPKEPTPALRALMKPRKNKAKKEAKMKQTKFSDTSKGARDSLSEGKLGRLRQQVLDFVRAHKARGATCYEAEVGLKLSHQTTSARCSELLKAGLIWDTGDRRATGSGRSARVYRALQMAEW